jgi:signal transduction protein with GAF and PtsI domain
MSLKEDKKMTEQHRINLEIYKLLVQTISEANDLDVMATQLSQLIVGALGIKGTALYILDPEREELELLASAGLSTNYVNKGPVLVDKSIKIESNRKPVIVSDAHTNKKLQYPDKAKEEGVRAIISHPIVMRGKIIGSLRLYHSQPWEPSPEEMILVEALSQNLGVALMYFRVANAMLNVKETVNDIHSVWL